VLSIPAEPNAAIHARTEAGRATSRQNAAIAANRGFMFTVPQGAGLHIREADADDLGAAIWTSNGGNRDYND